MPANETGYTVESQPSGAAADSWTTEQVLPPISGNLTQGQFQTSVSTDKLYRVLASTPSGPQLLATASGATSVEVNPASGGSIQFDKPEPISGTTTISISSTGGQPLSAQYFIDTISVGQSSTSPTFPASWDSTRVANGSHLANARLQFTPDFSVMLRRSFQVGNPVLTGTLSFIGTTGTVGVLVGAQSKAAAIQSVTFFVNGTQTQLLTVPNDPSGYRWDWDTTKYAAGTYQVSAAVIDAAGNQLNLSKNFTVDNPPVLTVTQPLGSDLVGNTLTISGSFTDDTRGASVQVFVGQIQILNTSQSPFQVSFDMTGLAEGPYNTKIVATDSAGLTTQTVRQVIYSPAGAQAYQRVLTLGPSGLLNGQLLDAENGTLLYVIPNNRNLELHLLSPNGSDTFIQAPAGFTNPAFGELSLGRVAFSASNSTSSGSSVFVWDAGQLTQLNGNAAGQFNDNIVFHWPWVMWTAEFSPAPTIVLENVTTQQQISIVTPPNSDYLINNGYDFFQNGPGDLTAFFSARTGPLTGNATFDVFSYSSTNQLTVQLSHGGQNTQVRTDGSLVSWLVGSSQGSGQINISPYIQPGSGTLFGTNVSLFLLGSGIVAWTQDATTSNPGISARLPDGTVQTFDSLVPIRLLSVKNNGVLWSNQNQTSEWTAQSGTVKIVPVPASGTIDVTGPVIVIGPDNAVYVHR